MKIEFKNGSKLEVISDKTSKRPFHIHACPLSYTSADIARLPSRQTEVLIGCEPKVKSKHKILQKLFIKIFGYKLVFDKRETKILEIKAEDCPKDRVDSNLSIEL